MNSTRSAVFALFSAAAIFTVATGASAGNHDPFRKPAPLPGVQATATVTPAEHESLAAYYRKEAARARAEVDLHRRMALGFSSHSPGAAAGMKGHCDRLAKAAAEAEKEYEELAAFHEAAAK